VRMWTSGKAAVAPASRSARRRPIPREFVIDFPSFGQALR
jgi:hypothetical protein